MDPRKALKFSSPELGIPFIAKKYFTGKTENAQVQDVFYATTPPGDYPVPLDFAQVILRELSIDFGYL